MELKTQTWENVVWTADLDAYLTEKFGRNPQIGANLEMGQGETQPVSLPDDISSWGSDFTDEELVEGWLNTPSSSQYFDNVPVNAFAVLNVAVSRGYLEPGSYVLHSWW